jgi:hypothetical protein
MREGSQRTAVWLVGAAAVAIAVAVSLRILLPAHMDATVFLGFGRDAPAQTSYGERLLGEVTTRGGGGHDGKYFFIIANDPWHLHPEDHAAFLDRPVYRSQRMLYPTIAGGFGLLPPGAIVWTLLLVNILALGVGATIAARLAMLCGSTPWLGLAVPLNLGLLFELWIDGSGIVAYVCCLAAVYAFVRADVRSASVLLALAALSREAMLAFAIGLVVLQWIRTRRISWMLLWLPVAATIAWNAYLQIRLHGLPGTAGKLPIFGAPFVGMFQAFDVWAEDPGSRWLEMTIVIVAFAFAARGIFTRSSIVWGALPFVFLAPLLSKYVWLEPSDLSRALAPVFTAVVFAVGAPDDPGIGMEGSP